MPWFCGAHSNINIGLILVVQMKKNLQVINKTLNIGQRPIVCLYVSIFWGQVCKYNVGLKVDPFRQQV